MRWERVPILGNNPVFCFEARRLWTRRTVLLMLLAVIVIFLVTCGINWPLNSLIRRPGTPPALFQLQPYVFMLVPAPISSVDDFTRMFSAFGWRWWSCVGYVLVLVLGWTGHVVSRYLVPALGAHSLAADRGAGHLEALAATRLSLGQIMLGKIAALILPVLALHLIVMAAASPLAFIRHVPPAQWALNVLGGMVGLFAVAIGGLCAGALVRHPPVAVGLTVALVGVLLPVAKAELGRVVAEHLASPSHWGTFQGTRVLYTPAGYHMYATATRALISVLLIAGCWFVTKRALARVGE